MSSLSHETSKPPEVLLAELDTIAPLIQEPVSQLKAEGWEEFYSYRESEPNGAINTGDIELALAEIDKLMPPSTRKEDWQIIRAKYDDLPKDYPLEQERIRALLRKKTAERLKWEAQPRQ